MLSCILTVSRSLDDVYDRIVNLLQGPLAKVVSEEAKACASLCKTMLAELRLGRCPLNSVLVDTSAMVVKFVDKLPNLIVYRGSGGNAPVYGTPALKKLYADVKSWSDEQRLSKGLSLVEPFHLWSFVVEDGMRADIDKWTKALHAKAGQQQHHKKEGRKHGLEASDVGKAKKAKKTKKDTLAKEVDELFV